MSMAALPLPGCAAVLAGLVLALVSGSSFAQQVSSGAGGGSGQGAGGGSGQGPGIGQGVGSKCEAAHGGHAGKACDDRDLSTYGDTCTGQETCEGFALQSVATEHAWSLTGTGTWSIGTGTRGVCVRACSPQQTAAPGCREAVVCALPVRLAWHACSVQAPVCLAVWKPCSTHEHGVPRCQSAPPTGAPSNNNALPRRETPASAARLPRHRPAN